MKEETKTKRDRNKDSGLTKFLLENIFGVIKSFVDRMFDSAQEAAAVFTKNLVLRLVLVVFIVVGMVFLLIGMARLLSSQYQIPGGGEALVGLLVLLVSFVLYAFLLRSKRQ